MWNDPDRAQALGRERAQLEAVVLVLENLTSGLADAVELLELAVDEEDADTVAELSADLDGYERQINDLEFRRMFAGELDPNDAFLEIQSGAGGTEAQDWAEMLLLSLIHI